MTDLLQFGIKSIYLITTESPVPANVKVCSTRQNQDNNSIPRKLIERSQTAVGSRVMGAARHINALALCIQNPPYHEVSYRGPTEDSCTIVFESGESHHTLPWQEPLKFDMEAIRTILLTVTEPGYLENLAVDGISLKILYADFMTFLLISDMKEKAK